MGGFLAVLTTAALSLVASHCASAQLTNPVVKTDVPCDGELSEWFRPFEFADWEPTWHSPTLTATFRIRKWQESRDQCRTSSYRIKTTVAYESQLFSRVIGDDSQANYNLPNLPHYGDDGELQGMNVNLQIYASGGTICLRHNKQTLANPWTCGQPDRACSSEGCCGVLCYPMREKVSVLHLPLLPVDNSLLSHTDIEIRLENPEKCAPGECKPKATSYSQPLMERAFAPDPAQTSSADKPGPPPSNSAPAASSCNTPGYGPCRLSCLGGKRYDCISYSFCSQLASQCVQVSRAQVWGRKLRQANLLPQ